MTPTTFTNADGTASLTLEIARPTWREKPDGTYDYLGQIQLAVAVLPPTTTPDQAIKDALKPVATIEDSQITDAEPLAGQPTLIASVDAEVQGMQVPRTPTCRGSRPQCSENLEAGPSFGSPVPGSPGTAFRFDVSSHPAPDRRPR